MKFQRHLDGFREYLRAHHFAARTLETYGANTKRFLAFLEQRYPHINTVEQVTKDTILDYQRHLAEHEDPRIGALTHATQNLILRSVRRSGPAVPVGLGQPLQREHHQPLGDVEDRHRGGAQERPDLLYVSPFGGDPSSASRCERDAHRQAARPCLAEDHAEVSPCRDRRSEAGAQPLPPPRADLSWRRRGDIPHTRHLTAAAGRVPHHHQGVPAQRDDAYGPEEAPDRYRRRAGAAVGRGNRERRSREESA